MNSVLPCPFPVKGRTRQSGNQLSARNSVSILPAHLMRAGSFRLPYWPPSPWPVARCESIPGRGTSVFPRRRQEFFSPWSARVICGPGSGNFQTGTIYPILSVCQVLGGYFCLRFSGGKCWMGVWIVCPLLRCQGFFPGEAGSFFPGVKFQGGQLGVQEFKGSKRVGAFSPVC